MGLSIMQCFELQCVLSLPQVSRNQQNGSTAVIQPQHRPLLLRFKQTPHTLGLKCQMKDKAAFILLLRATKKRYSR